jgi:hypothetical protein
VLVADYVDHTARRWADALARAGFIVHRCRPIDIGPALLQAYQPHVLVVAVSRLRSPISYSDLEGRQVPVIIVSADPDDRGRTSQFGCARVLPRPAKIGSMLESVRSVLGSSWNETRESPRLNACGARERSVGPVLRARSKQLCDRSLDLRRQAAALVTAAQSLAHPWLAVEDGSPRWWTD